MAETPSELKTEIEKLEARHAANPEGRFFVPLANAYRKGGEVDRAEALLREGLRQHPDYLSAHIVLGRCLADRGATGEARGEFQYVLSIDPQNLIALRTLGELAVDAGRTEEAARWYEQLLGVDPMNEEARRALDSLPAAPAGEEAPGLSPGAEWWAEPSASTAPAAAGEVVTETIAALYARQGLHDRAAEVYRELIRRRGGDPELERRLAEVEAAGAESSDDRPPLPVYADVTPSAAEDDLVLLGDDPFAASFERGFQGDEPEPEPEPEPETPGPASTPAESPPAEEEEEEGVTIAAYLADLVAWRRGSGPVLEPESTPVPEPEPGETPAPEAPAERDPWETPESADAGGLEPWETAAHADPAPTPDGTLPAEEPAFPWELPADPGPTPAAHAEAEMEHPETGREPDPRPAPRPETARAAADDAADEDDLESFQAWLRSLKR